MAIATGRVGTDRDGHLHRDWGYSSDGNAPGEYALDGVAVNRLAFPARRVAHRGVSDAVDIAKRAGGVFVHQRDRICGEDGLVRASELKPIGDVLGDVLARDVVQSESVMDARVQRAVAPSLELLFKFGQPDQDQRQECTAIPLVIQEDV